jgi:hypothetical protein
VQVIVVPTHWPLPEQVSAKVQALPSSHAAPVLGVTVQLAVPLQVRVLHVSEVQVIAVPTHWPLLLQVSLKVQVSPSSHAVPVLGVTVQLAVPLQVRVLHASEVQVTAVLWQTPASQVSTVQAFPSLQSATVEQGVQPAMAVLWQTPASQVSVVQAFWSSQSAAVEQSVQPAMGVPAHCPLPSQTSSEVQALPSSHGVAAGWKTSGGQYTLVPVQVSAMSHAPAAALQTVPALAGGWMHRPLPSHSSALQTLPSSSHAVPLEVGAPMHIPA